MSNSITRQSLLDVANKRGWRTEVIGTNDYLLKITDQHGRMQLFHGSTPLLNSHLGARVCLDKELSLKYITHLGYSVPAYKTIDSVDEAAEFLDLHESIVIKPVDGSQSAGVTVDIRKAEQLADAIRFAKDSSASGRVIAQKFLEGRLYRVVIVDGQVVAAAMRTAPTVVGDGHSSVHELIQQKNEDPRRSKAIDSPLKPIDIHASTTFLGQNEMVRIPTSGEQVRVAAIDSISVGGESREMTEEVDKTWAEHLARITTSLSLFICGFDIICDDMALPIVNNYLPILEMNSMPGFKLHSYPTAGGEVIDLAAIVLDKLFPHLA